MTAGSVVNQPDVATAVEALSGVADCRLEYEDISTVVLKPYGGLAIIVDSEAQFLPPSGLSYAFSDNMIDATGGDSGNQAENLTDAMLYLYISNSAVAFAAGELRGSVTPPVVGNFGPQLAAGISQWRFVGWSYIDSGGKTRATATKRYVCSYYNRKTIDVFFCAAYADDNAVTSYTPGAASANWVTFSPGGTALEVEFIDTGEDETGFAFVCTKTAGLIGVGIGLSFDGANQVSASQELAGLAGVNGTVAYNRTRNNVPDFTTAAKRKMTAVYHDNGVTAPTFMIDGGRHGNATDVPASYLSGKVWN